MTDGEPKRGLSLREADRVLADMADQMLIGQANRYYEAGEWATALALYDTILERNPPIANKHALPLAIAHCRIELAEPQALGTLALPAIVVTGEQPETMRVMSVEHRIAALNDRGEFARASRLLRVVAGLEPRIAETYRVAVDPGLTGCAGLPASAAEPAFVRACGVSEPAIEALRRRHHGMRALLVTHHYATTRRHEIADNLVRSAIGFGFDVREEAVPIPGAVDAAQYLAAFERRLAEFAPALVVFEELVLRGMSEDGDRLADGLRAILRTARGRFGTRVVRCDADAWYPTAVAPDQLYGGLGDYLDLVQHHHAALLGDLPAGLRDSVFLCPFPTIQPALDGAPAAVARGCFVGAIHGAAISRLVWWTESGARGLPIDFRVNTRTREEAMSDLDYVRLLSSHRFALNFTRRATGARTLTARTIEVPMCGGLLVEENSADTPYFLAPGVHYAPFETLDDLAAVADALLSDDRRRRRMAADAHAWVSRYFGGDYFWGGMLARLWG